jgi:thiosulfate/3-mercaptopyruvate sulfurtransferase
MLYTGLITALELSALKDAFVIDCSFDLADAAAGEAAYAAGHLPGAVYLHLERDASGPKIGTPPSTGRHPLPSRTAFAATLAKVGLNNGQQVVLVDRSGGMYAARVWWMLRWLGVEAAAVLDGGVAAWQAAGLPLEAGVVTKPAGNFAASGSLVGAWSKADVAANVRHKSKLVIDARAPERYRGEVEPLDPVAGHIPGALNRPFKDNLHADGMFKSPEQLNAEFTKLLGRYAPADVVAQCGSGVTACHNLLAMHAAGLPGALLYPGSWSEYCADASMPIAKEKV